MFVPRALVCLAALSATAMAQIRRATTTAPQTTSAPAPASTSGSDSDASGPSTIIVSVGAAAHAFSPNQITAKVGDTVQFNFYPTNHSVVRAEFGWPCIPFEYANLVDGPGFDSGFHALQALVNPPPSFSLLINDTKPIFFYCAAPNSCATYHMIGVINPNATQTFDAQMAYAQNVTYQLAPGDKFPDESAKPTITNGVAVLPTATAASSGDGGSSSLSPGAIAGIAIGGAAVVIMGVALVYLCGRRGGFDKAYRKSAVAGAVAAAPPAAPVMVEQYANGHGEMPKSPGEASMSTFIGGAPHDRGSVPNAYGHHSVVSTPSPGLGIGNMPAYGYQQQQQQQFGHQGHGSEQYYASPLSSPRPDTYVPPPVELPSGDYAPVPTQSPPPGYHQGRESWGGHDQISGQHGKP